MCKNLHVYEHRYNRLKYLQDPVGKKWRHVQWAVSTHIDCRLLQERILSRSCGAGGITRISATRLGDRQADKCSRGRMLTETENGQSEAAKMFFETGEEGILPQWRWSDLHLMGRARTTAFLSGEKNTKLQMQKMLWSEWPSEWDGSLELNPSYSQFLAKPFDVIICKWNVWL